MAIRVAHSGVSANSFGRHSKHQQNREMGFAPAPGGQSNAQQ